MVSIASEADLQNCQRVGVAAIRNAGLAEIFAVGGKRPNGRSATASCSRQPKRRHQNRAAPRRRLECTRESSSSAVERPCRGRHRYGHFAGRVGLKPTDFGAHSLRAGFLTSAARRGASVFKMRYVSRHKSMDVLQAYVRDADLFRDHAGIGLLWGICRSHCG
jgi:hypothetical protein